MSKPRSASTPKKFYGDTGYATSRERLVYLHEVVKEGEKAAVVKEYMDTLVEEEGAMVLQCLAEGNGDPVELQIYYKAVVEISRKINYDVAQGLRKKETIQKITKG